MGKPLISVVIPVYNEEKRVVRAVNSIRNQTYQNLEIVVVDDDSTDNTYRVVEEITKEDPRVLLYKNPKVPARENWRGYDINAGWAARNYGFKQVKGEWVVIQDADDASLLNRVEVQYELAKKYDAMCVTVQWTHLTDENMGKKLDVERIFNEKGEDVVVVRPEYIATRAKMNRGILMIEPLHQFIPFTLKWFPYTRRLFYYHQGIYPGADNSMLFSRKVFDDGIYFRPRNQRTWGTPDGRGSGRDFAYRVAVKYGKSWSFNLPMYLWSAKDENTDYTGYEKYLV